MNHMGLFLAIVGALILVATVWCAIGYAIVTIMEMIEKFMEKHFPKLYYYDYEEEV